MLTRSRRAMTLPEVLVIVLIIVVILQIFLIGPSRDPSATMARRTVCLANLRGISQSCITYAAGNNNHFPCWNAAAEGGPLGAPGFTRIGQGYNWDGMPGDPNDPGTGVVSNSRNLWLLVRMQAADPKSFICPSDPEAGDPYIPQDAQGTYDVQNRSQFSYSFQYQGPALAGDGQPRSVRNTTLRDDPKLVVLADRSPMLRAKNPACTDPKTGCQFEIARGDNFGKRFIQALREGLSGIKYDATGHSAYQGPTGKLLAALNSPNHKCEGQNIARLDGSGDFAANPWCGAYMDNIWTVQDPAEYAQPSSVQNKDRLLECRMRGLYDKSETDMLKAWQANDPSRRNFPDSFLVP